MEVIRENDTPKPRTINQTRRLEDILVLFCELHFTLRILQRNIAWVDVGATLVNLKYLVGNVLTMTFHK
jgi:hypothetical protein